MHQIMPLKHSNEFPPQDFWNIRKMNSASESAPAKAEQTKRASAEQEHCASENPVTTNKAASWSVQP
jgi:hypothetical protein